ncbi:helix-turn-helix domain-containing protein [Fulvivirga lutea]|uniref:Helix-turn-helix transcriptional regulator n=1 Tax=Fulvivirga lutea TaxID=2810512 RepID=A0A974ZZT6_9BACT|nr:AraC family transcriptional regulator [Fulvivirga lutea]QSE96475.1 helix-turn-helix transcriptional regulator [Fulvivirga lutea]
MPFSDIVLVIISGLGVIHGLFLAVFLFTYTKGNSLTNKLLAYLLLILSFRIGKSVFLEFAEDLHTKIIFIGLATMFMIGPLFLMMVKTLTDQSFTVKSKHYLHFIPALIGLIFGFWMEEVYLSIYPIWLFAIAFLTYYLHLLIYLLIGFLTAKKNSDNLNQSGFKLIKLLFFGLIIIWFAYVLNLFDDDIPYIIGPILYSMAAYTISFIVIKEGLIEKVNSIKYKTTSATDEQINELYHKVEKLIEEESLFENADLTLQSLSSSMRVSPQLLSMAINKKANQNFNSFINQFRIEKAKSLFENEAFNNRTISSIAFDVGFNSISSFNTAFKKLTKETPNSYRNKFIK